MSIIRHPTDGRRPPMHEDTIVAETDEPQEDEINIVRGRD